MKFNAFLCSFIAIIFKLLVLTNSAYLFSSDLQFNIPESFKANFKTDSDFEQFLKDLIHKLKTRIAEKLYQSFKIRSKIKQNLIKINGTSGNKATKSLENLNDISQNFHDYVMRINNFQDESFEKMIIQSNRNNNTTEIANGKGSGFLNESNKKIKNLQKMNKDKEVIDLNKIKTSTLIKGEKVLDSFGSEFDRSDIESKNEKSDRSAYVSIENLEGTSDDEQEYSENKLHEGFLNNDVSNLHLDFQNKIKQRNNSNLTKIDTIRTDSNRISFKNRNKNKLNEEVFRVKNSSSLNKNLNRNGSFYFFENENYLSLNKSFYDFSNVFFNSDKNFQSKIFGKKLIDYFSSDKLNLSENLLDSFYKFYLNLKTDKKAVEDKKYSLLKKEVDFFSLLEKGKSPGSSGNSHLKNNRISKDKTSQNLRKNQSFFLNITQNYSKNIQGISNKLNYLEKNETFSSTLNKINRFSGNRESRSVESANAPSFAFSSATSNKRKIKIYIDSENECDVFFEDKVFYEADNFTNYFLDHVILNRKSNLIEPRGVKANNASIKYFVFNRKLNMFSIDIDKKAEQNFSIKYDYVASGLIGVMINDVSMNPELDKNLNVFMWKVYNENTENRKLNLEIEVYFGLGEEYDYSKVKFNHAFVKREKLFRDKNLTYFSWTGDLLPYEVITINSFFPMIFKNCGMEKLNISLIILGSLFVILVIISVYLMIVNIIKDFY